MKMHGHARKETGAASDQRIELREVCGARQYACSSTAV